MDKATFYGNRIGGSSFSWSSYWNTLISATVENAAPTKVILTFSKANISLVTTDFTIAGKTITLLERDATNKILTLTVSVAFVYGDTPVVTFVKTGGTANVTNNVLQLPVYGSSVIADVTSSILEMTYSLSLANVVPATSAFAVLVNAVARTVNSVAIVGGKVQLTLASAIIYNDVVTVAYTKPATNPLQTTAGGLAISITAQSVTNNVLYTMLLTSTGTGAGVSTLKMQVSSDITITLGANAKFYTDAAGTLNESATWTITAGALRTIYLKCTTGTALMTFSDVSKVIKWGSTATDGWTSSTNASKITTVIGKMPLTELRIAGTSALSGALPTELTYLTLSSNSVAWTYSGALPTGLTYLYFNGASIAWTYSGALPTELTYLSISGTSVAWTYSGALPTGLTYLTLSGTSMAWTYSGALPTGLTYLSFNSASIAWTYSEALPTGLTSLSFSGASIAWTYSGALPTGLTYLTISGTSIAWTGLDVGNNGNITAFSLSNYRITKMSSADMVTLLTQMTNRTGTLPTTCTINDYADYASPPQAVTDAVATLKTAKSITTINLGA
jgi:hypothetical protein